MWLGSRIIYFDFCFLAATHFMTLRISQITNVIWNTVEPRKPGTKNNGPNPPRRFEFGNNNIPTSIPAIPMPHMIPLITNIHQNAVLFFMISFPNVILRGLTTRRVVKYPPENSSLLFQFLAEMYCQ